MQGLTTSIWYRRMSLVYLLGAWTTVGSTFLSTWKKKETLAKEEALKDKDLAKEEALKNEDSAEEPEPKRGFYVQTTVTYKEDFVPYTTRLYNYWKSWSNGPAPSE